MLKIDPFSGSLSSGGGGNATVPLTFALQPPACAVANTYRLFQTIGGRAGLGNLFPQLEGFGSDFFDYWVQPRVSYGNSIICNADGNLFATAAVDYALSSFAGFVPNVVSLDFSGTDMGVPTPAQAHIDGRVTLTFTTLDFPNGVGDFGVDFQNEGSPCSLHVYSRGDLALADSVLNGGLLLGLNLNLGTSDTPSLAALAAKTVELLLGGNFAGVTTNITALGAVVTIIVSDDSHLPLGRSGPTVLNAAGQEFQRNAHITTINSGGGTVTVMEWVNRVDDTDGKEVVIYTP